MSEDIEAEVRRIVRDNARLIADADTLGSGSDLFAAGMSSHASVTVMLALEDHFAVEFPDEMLTRAVFGSIGGLTAAITELRAA